MITSMEVLNTQPDVPELPLGGFMPNHAAVQVRDIQGLGPVKAEIATTPFATGRGGLHQGAAIDRRNIVITFGLNPNWIDQTITSLRQLLYRYFMTGYWAELRFLSDELPTVAIKGQSESFEPNQFAQDPEMQVSLICPKPDFVDLEATFIEGSTIDLASLTIADITYEDHTAGDVEDIDYIGTAPSGFELQIEGSYTGDLAFVNATPDIVQYLLVENVVIDATHRFDLNTVRSLRGIFSVNPSSGVSSNMLAKMDKLTDWPEFLPGANRFAVYAESELSYALGYFNRFGGL